MIQKLVFKMIKQKEKQKKYQRCQNQSLMTLGTSNNADPTTKKTIQAEEIFNSSPIPQNNNRIYVFKLPYHTEISVLVSAITTRFSNRVIHAEQDEMGAQMIFEGLKCPGIRGKVAKLFDYFVFCCSRGLRFGKLEETYNVILLTIRKQVIDNTCLITVTNPYSHLTNNLPKLFYIEILLNLQQELKIVMKGEEHEPIEEYYMNPALNQSSPTKMDIGIHKKIYQLFVLPDNKQYSRFKNLFLQSLERIVENMTNYRQKMNNPNVPVKRLPNPSQTTEAVIRQSQTLLQSLKNSYQQQDRHEMNFLHSLLCSQTAQTITLYTIEEAICMHHLTNIRQIYQYSLLNQCQSFNRNVQHLNQNKTDEECFQHLTLKKKYRLPNQLKPYHAGIMRLKGLQHCNSLREGLLIIQQTFSDVKTDCFVSYKGKVELSSMDQLLPVIIFISVRSAVKNLPVWITIIGDYVRMRSVFQLEERIMTAFYAAVQDISRGWDEPQSK